MKKILVILLIFTVTSLTNATVWTITDELMSPTYAITVSVIDNPRIDLGLALAVDSGGILSDFAAGPDAPADSSSYGTLEDNYWGSDWSYLGQGEIWGMEDWYLPCIYNDGDWLTATFAFAPGETSATISLYLFNGEIGGEVLLTSHSMGVPEPITLSLLAFGGLFLRRRK
jgi:hypothetical protein